MRRADVVVLGAGVAGLAAARALSQAGRRVVIIEARPRVGGRVLTLHDRAWPLPAELGAEFLHGEAPHARRAAEAAGARVVELPDVHVWAAGGRLRPMDDTWDDVGRLLASARRLRADVTFADFLARRRASREVCAMARLFVEGYTAAHLQRASARWLGEGAEETQSQRQYRLEGGYHQIVEWLRAGLDPERTEVRLGTTATAVEWSRGAVRVRLRSATGRPLPPVSARAAIVTLPVGVLKAEPPAAGAVEFRPAVPGLRATLARLEMGPVRKVLLRFRTAFWPDTLAFLHDARGPFPTWWTAVPRRVPVLTAWAGGPAADALSSLTEPALVERALEALARSLALDAGRIREQLEGWATHDWQADPFSRGAYAYVGVGGLKAPRTLARPVQGTLFFAGEATSVDEMGTVSGAIGSGLQAARKLAMSRKTS